MDPDGREVITHNDKTGLDRVLAEIKDCFGYTVKCGLGVDAKISLGVGEVNISLNGGGTDYTFDKYGEEMTDVVGASAKISIADNVKFGLGIEKTAPSTDSHELHDAIDNAWSGETNIDKVIEFGISDLDVSATDNDDVKIGIGAQLLLGGEVWVDVTEVLDLGASLYNSAKDFVIDLFKFE